MEPGSETLVQGCEGRLFERLEECGLRQQERLKRLASRLQVPQQPYLFQKLGAQMMGLVDDHHEPFSLGTDLESVLGEAKAENLFGVGVGQAEVEENVLQEGGAVRKSAVRQEGADGLVAEALEEDLAEQRLAGARFADQKGAAFIVANGPK